MLLQLPLPYGNHLHVTFWGGIIALFVLPLLSHRAQQSCVQEMQSSCSPHLGGKISAPFGGFLGVFLQSGTDNTARGGDLSETTSVQINIYWGFLSFFVIRGEQKSRMFP